MSCQIKCGGFDSVRSECARDACLAINMCKVQYPNVKDCRDWCCQSRSWYVFFIVFFFCAGSFALCCAYYLHRLHQINVAGGAVDKNGVTIEVTEAPTEEELAANRRKKRNVKVDPALLSGLKK